ncbi:MAG: hypothetical protein H7A46_22220 [Verrucomicrobiales bacterium]|nr:hypothetical protein [Verrucomicrobiales bacterium]
MNASLFRRFSRSLAWAVLFPVFVQAESPGRPPIVRYTLLPDSSLIDDCGPCGRPTLLLPLRGTLDLQLIDENPVFAHYAIRNIDLLAGWGGEQRYRVTGEGELTVGGEVALTQAWRLTLSIDNGNEVRATEFTNQEPTVERPWPMLKARLDETDPGIFFYRIELAAAPFRELWFSTTAGMTPGLTEPYNVHLTGGDLLASDGRVVKRNAELSRNLGLMPLVPDLGLDAVDLLPGGEVAFSLPDGVFSESLGDLRDGDVLSDHGRVVRTQAELIGAFGSEVPPGGEGLDALQFAAGDEVYFSVRNGFYSGTLGRQIGRGDLLSSQGTVLRTNAELLSRFKPVDAKTDYGLDAVHVWPGGEVWFSVEDGFQGPNFENYGRGDLLSDQGYVVIRNLDLVAPFSPLEDLADFGLDALFIVTDLPPAGGVLPAPTCVSLAVDPGTGNVTFEWKAPGRVFQLERAEDVLGPWLPRSAIVTEPPAVDPGAAEGSPRGFYRLRQW